MANMVKRIGILTSGGDAPGMNAAVRAVVRTALGKGIECVGIRRGWAGLIAGDICPMNSGSVSRIINRIDGSRTLEPELITTQSRIIARATTRA